MLRSSRLASAVLIASFVTPFALAAHTHMATPSTWTLNQKESNWGGGPSMKSDTFIMLTDTEKRAKFTDTMVDGDGKTWKLSWSGPADGSAHPMVGMKGATFSDNAAADMSVFVMPDGMSVTCNFSLNADKKKFVEKCVVKTQDGKQANQTLVYDRTK